MRVKVQYLGPIRTRLSKREEEVELGDESIFSLIQSLCTSYGDWFRREVMREDGKGVREDLVVTVNGVALGQIGGLEAKLKEGDVVTILPFFAGGG
jgi:MoaD family protein